MNRLSQRQEGSHAFADFGVLEREKPNREDEESGRNNCSSLWSALRKQGESFCGQRPLAGEYGLGGEGDTGIGFAQKKKEVKTFRGSLSSRIRGK